MTDIIKSPYYSGTANDASRDSTEAKKPNYTLRRAVALGGIAVVGLLSGNFVKGQREVDVMQKIQSAGPAAVAGYEAGKFNKSDVAEVTVTKSQTAFSEAQELVADDKDVRPMVDVITSQTGTHVDKGENLAAPTSQLDPNIKTK